MRTAVRAAGYGVLMVVAVIVYVWLAPGRSPFQGPYRVAAVSFADAIETALDGDELNQGFTDSAIQQQVANGWIARDLLVIIATENAALLDVEGARSLAGDAEKVPLFDDRIPALLLIGLAAICWTGLTTRPPTVVVNQAPAYPPPFGATYQG